MHKTILNLGAGVQSTTLALLAVRGRLPKPDLAVFADTQWEPQSVYLHLWWLAGELDGAGIPLHIVTAGDIRADALRSQVRGRVDRGGRGASLPFHTMSPGGSKGMIRRQCTREYKIDPINRWVRREVFGLRKGQRMPAGASITRWLGISLDEVSRTRTSREKWARNVYPLIDFDGSFALGKSWRRSDCIAWLRENYSDRHVPRSACIGCPFHSDDEWRHMKAKEPDAWADAVSFDAAIRQCGGLRGKTYLHASCRPLDVVDLRTAADRGQLSMFENDCEGMCGL